MNKDTNLQSVLRQITGKKDGRNMGKNKYSTRSLSFRIISRNVLILLTFSVIVSAIGYALFTDSLTRSYNDFAFQTAETAASVVSGDRIGEFLESGGNDSDYQAELKQLQLLCRTQGVTLIYVIAVDQTDYNSFQSVFNVPSAESGYTPWEVGYKRNTTNEEYRSIYRDIYENGLERGTIYRLKDLGGKDPHITSLIPVHASDGSVSAILCVQRPMKELTVGRYRYLREVAAVVLVLSVLVSIGTAVYLRRQFVRPVRQLALEAERFANENSRNHELKLSELSTISELHALGTSIEKMEEDTIRNMENIRQMTVEREKGKAELTLATQIQKDAIPSNFPQDERFTIYGSMTPAKAVGGDFYDFFLIDHDHLGLVIADVSDKGIPAALFMMISKIVIHNFAIMGASPKAVLEEANKMIVQHNQSSMFVTVWFGILTLTTGEIVAANAGHEYPMIKKADGQFELFKDPHGLPVGVMEGISYKEYRFKLERGGTLFVYTDGLAEASNEAQKFFGTDRILEELNKAQKADPKELLTNMKASVDRFAGNAPQFDDLTMLAVRLS